MNIKKISLSLVVIFTFLAYALNQRLTGVKVNSLSLPQAVNNSQTITSIQPSVQPNIQPATTFKDGSYTGNVVDAFYGNVQVKAVIQNGKITDVQFLDYPHDRNTSVEINTQATPLLKSEAIAAQSAQVDGVSGATQTSRAFMESLQSALTQAI